jgi:hypothetical protein
MTLVIDFFFWFVQVNQRRREGVVRSDLLQFTAAEA